MKEKLSAMVDGQLDREGSAAMFDALDRDAALRRTWAQYCLVGDVLRGEDAEGGTDLAARVMSGLVDEPTVLAPPAPRPASVHPWMAHLLPLAASVAGVALVAWLAFSLSAPGQSDVPVLAVQQAAPAAEQLASAAGEPARSPEDLHREYLFAHQGLAGDGPIPGVVQYVRTVSDVRQDSAR